MQIKKLTCTTHLLWFFVILATILWQKGGTSVGGGAFISEYTCILYTKPINCLVWTYCISSCKTALGSFLFTGMCIFLWMENCGMPINPACRHNICSDIICKLEVRWNVVIGRPGAQFYSSICSKHWNNLPPLGKIFKFCKKREAKNKKFKRNFQKK